MAVRMPSRIRAIMISTKVNPRTGPRAPELACVRGAAAGTLMPSLWETPFPRLAGCLPPVGCGMPLVGAHLFRGSALGQLLEGAIGRAGADPSCNADHMADGGAPGRCHLNAACAGDGALPSLEAHIADVDADAELAAGGQPFELEDLGIGGADGRAFLLAAALARGAGMHDVAAALGMLAEAQLHGIGALDGFAARLLQIGHQRLRDRLQALALLKLRDAGDGLAQQNARDRQPHADFHEA